MSNNNPDQEFRDLNQVARRSDEIKKIAENLLGKSQMFWMVFLVLSAVIILVLAYDIHQVQSLNSDLSEAIKLQNDQAESSKTQLATDIENLKREMVKKIDELQKTLNELVKIHVNETLQ